MMNVLWLAPHPVPNNSNMHPAPWITSLADELTSAGVNITILTTSSKITKPIEEFEYSKYKLIVVKVPKGILNLISFYKLSVSILGNYISEIVNKFDLVHVHGTEFQYASSIRNYNLDIPVIISIQGILTEYKNFLNVKSFQQYIYWSIGSLYERKDVSYFRNFMCRTQWDKAFVKKYNSHSHIFSIWELLRDEFFDAKYNPGEDILFSGGANLLKGLKDCLKTFNAFAAIHNCKLHIMGGCGWETIVSYKTKFSLDNINSENVILHGLLDAKNIVNLYNKCFCLYHPSLIDNSPNTICEAQVAGLPVIANNVGGVSSLIKHMETGILINKGESNLNALLKLKSSPDLCKYISENSRKESAIRHNKKIIVNETITAYKKLILKDKP